jgi:membrane protease YdiL (CAAX protease family)
LDAIITAMPNSPGRFRAVVAAGWVLLALGAWIYARMKHVPEWAAVPIAAAFLIEFPFYILPAFEAPRAWFARQGKIGAASLLAASAIAPWLVYSIGAGEAQFTNFLLLLSAAVIVSFWYIVLPARAITDALFLIFLAGILLSKIFDQIYHSPIPKLSLSILGHVMLIRSSALAILILRGNVAAEYRFLPNRAEWITGLRYFAMMLPVIGLAYWGLGLVRLRPHPLNVVLAAGTFLGMLWVLALSEEFFFRGLLQQWLERWTGKPVWALVLTAMLFGSVHLGFHHIFPNWRWAIVAGILGLFCGIAWQKSRSVQASMVAHALTVTVWRVFFQ